jgi:tetratricopeptide (TPR) repeat protein
LLARLETKPILIVGTYRSEEVSEDHPLLQLVRAWEPKNLLHTLPLGRLTAMEVEELLRKLPLALKRFDLFCQRLYEETEGIPLFLIATLQHFFEEGALKITGKVWVTDIEDISSNYRELLIPPTVKDLIVRRLSRLSEPEQKLLELASVIGRTFEFPLLERAWEGNGDCLRTLEGLIRAHVLVERQDRYAFSHDKIREVVYEGMSLPRRQQLHRRVLEALENVYAGESETQAVLRAQHAYQGGQWKKALEYSLQALTKAVKEYRHQEGLHLVEWGLESAQRLEAAGEDRAHLTGLRFELLAHREAIFDLQGRRQEQERDLEQMQLLAERLGDQRKLALVFQKRGKMYWRLGRFLEAEETTQKALKLHADLKDQQAQGDCLNTLGLVYRSLGRPQEALRCHQQALEHYEQIGDRQGQGYSLSHIGVVYWGWGQWDEALRYHRQALQIFQEIGDRKGQGGRAGQHRHCVFSVWARGGGLAVPSASFGDLSRDREPAIGRAYAAQPRQCLHGLIALRRGAALLSTSFGDPSGGGRSARPRSCPQRYRPLLLRELGAVRRSAALLTGGHADPSRDRGQVGPRRSPVQSGLYLSRPGAL